MWLDEHFFRLRNSENGLKHSVKSCGISSGRTRCKVLFLTFRHQEIKCTHKFLTRNSTLRSPKNHETPVLGKYNLRNYSFSKEIPQHIFTYFHLFPVSYYSTEWHTTCVISRHWKTSRNIVLNCSWGDCYETFKKLVRNSEYWKSDNLTKLSVLAEILSFLSKKYLQSTLPSKNSQCS